MSFKSKKLRYTVTLNDEILPEDFNPDALIRYAELSDVSEGEPIRWQEPMRFEEAPSRARRVVRPGDVIVSTVRTYLRAIAHVVDPPESAIASTGFGVLRPRGIDSKFLKYATLSQRFIDAVVSRSVGVSYPAINPSELLNISLPAPNPGEQQQIADYLDHETTEIDAFIAAHEQLQELTSLRLETTIEAAITLSSPDFLQLRRLKPLRQSGTSVNAESRPAFSGELGVLKTGAASKGYFDPAENKAVTEDQEVARLSTPVVKDRVLVNRANTPDLVGTAVYVPEDYPELYLSDKLWIVDFDASNQFLALALSTRSYREQVSQFVVGASSSMQNLSYGDFLSIRVPVPSVEQQNQVVVALQSSIRATRALGTEITTAIHLARERRAALITAAVTGQIDVTARNKPAAEQLEDDIAQGLHREYA